MDPERFPVAGAPRLFTAAEANALLVELDPIVARMREAAEGGGRPDASEIVAQHELAESVEQLHESLETLQGLGIQVKDPARGLIDFPSERAGEIVELCWLHGEPAVSHWHRIGEGFAGRRPIGEEDQ